MDNHVGLVICKEISEELGILDEVLKVVEEYSDSMDDLTYFPPINCRNPSKRALEEISGKVDRLILLASSPYEDDLREIISALSHAGFNPHLIKVINLRLSLSNGKFEQRYLIRELLFWTRYLFLLNRNKLTLTLARFKNKLKRRDLLKLVSRGFLERRFLPSIDKGYCIADYGCTKCIDLCPTNALKLWDKKKKDIEVFESKCVSCGICESVCPTNAIEVHNVNNYIIQSALSETITKLDESPIIIVSCGVRLYNKLISEAPNQASDKDALNLVLECVGGFDPIKILSALKMGARGIILLDCQGNCPYGIKEPLISENHSHARRIAKLFEMDDERIEIVGVENPNWLKKLDEAMENIKSKEAPTTSREPILFEKGEIKYKTLITRLGSEYRVEPKGTISTSIYGPISIKVDQLKCTMCNACVANCPSGALHMEKETDKMTLKFIPANCVSCKNCIEICPENAMSYEEKIELRDISVIAEVDLKVDQIAKCRNCGKPIGPISLLKKVERLLRVRWSGNEKAIEHIYYCENCKKLKALGLI